MAEEEKTTDLVQITPEIVTQIDNADLSGSDYEMLVGMGIEVGEAKVYTQWVLGKLGDAVTKKYGDLKKYSEDINQKYGVLQQYMNTYRKFIGEDPEFTPNKYQGSVPWGLLQLAATKSDKPQELVNSLQDEGVRTTDGAYRKIKEEETGQTIPHKPHVNFKWNEEAQKFRMVVRAEDFDLIDWANVRDQVNNYTEAHT